MTAKKSLEVRRGKSMRVSTQTLYAQLDMSEAHLTDLRKVLEQNGNEYDISDVWVVERPDGTGIFHLEFEGLDDLNVLPIS